MHNIILTLFLLLTQKLCLINTAGQFVSLAIFELEYGDIYNYDSSAHIRLYRDDTAGTLVAVSAASRYSAS